MKYKVLSFLAALAFMSCGSEKVPNDLVYIPQRNMGICEKNFDPIPLDSTEGLLVPSADAIPLGTYTLDYTEVFVTMSGGDKKAKIYLNQMNAGGTLARSSCSENLDTKEPLFNANLPGFNSYWYIAAQTSPATAARRELSAVEYRAQSGSDLKIALNLSNLGTIQGAPDFSSAYSEIRFYKLAGDKLMMRAHKTDIELTKGRVVDKYISQVFSRN